MPQNFGPPPVGLSYAHISNAGTSAVKATPALLADIAINSASTGATITLIDNKSTVSATPVIGVITLGAAVVTPTKLSYGDSGVSGIQTNTGLVVLTTGTIDLTVVYK